MRRLPKQRLYRGLLKANMITEKDIPLIQRKLADFRKYQQLNVAFTENRGHRWANRLQAFARWLWENREAILRILGVVIMFADDGTPQLVDADELDAKTLKEAKQKLAKRKPMKYTPHGEKVEDFTEPSDEVPTLVTNESVVPKESVEKNLDELTKLNQGAGLYDIGIKNPLIKDEGGDEVAEGKEVQGQEEAEGEVSDEVQLGSDRGEDTSRYESDDV